MQKQNKLWQTKFLSTKSENFFGKFSIIKKEQRLYAFEPYKRDCWRNKRIYLRSKWKPFLLFRKWPQTQETGLSIWQWFAIHVSTANFSSYLFLSLILLYLPFFPPLSNTNVHFKQEVDASKHFSRKSRTKREDINGAPAQYSRGCHSEQNDRHHGIGYSKNTNLPMLTTKILKTKQK